MKAKRFFILLPMIVMFIGHSQAQISTLVEGSKTSFNATCKIGTIFQFQGELAIEKQIVQMAQLIQPKVIPNEWKGNGNLEKALTYFITMEIASSIENGTLCLVEIEKMIASDNYSMMIDLIRQAQWFNQNIMGSFGLAAKPHPFNRHYERNHPAPRKHTPHWKW